MATILLLEDDLTLAMHYREWLEELGHIVYHEVNCETAKLTLDEVNIDLVVTDIMIHGPTGEPMVQGGLSLISHARLNVRPTPRIIAITGTNPTIALIKHAEALNVDGRLLKPLTQETLGEEVRRVLSSPSRRPTDL